MILVTGGTGFVGRRLVAALAGRGSAVRVLTRARARADDLPRGVDVAVGDLLDSSTLDRALRDVTSVVHFAASLPGSNNAGPERFRTNADGTRALARAARARGVTLFVHGSSAGVYGDGTTQMPHREDAPAAARSAYERSKLEAERAVVEELVDSGTRWVMLRPTGVYGPGRPATLAFYRDVQRKTIWVHGPSLVVVHPTYVEDVVHATLLVLERADLAGETFNVAGERPIAYQDLIQMAGMMLGRRVVQVTMPVRAISRALEHTCRALGMQPPDRLTRLTRPMINRAVDTSKARQVLGFEAAPLEQSIRETVDSFRHDRLL